MNSVDEQANRLTETLGKAFLSHRITLDDCRRIVAEVLKTARQAALLEAEQAMFQLIDGRGLTAIQVLEAQTKIKFAFHRLASEGA